jgi:hypothetical protein
VDGICGRELRLLSEIDPEPVAAELGRGTWEREPVTLREMVEKDDFQPATPVPPPAVLAISRPANADLRSPPWPASLKP